MPYPLPLTRTEAYLAYKAGVIQQSDLKPSLAVPRNGIDAWLAYWTGLAEDYPKREDGTPHILQEEEAYIAYLCGVIDEYPEKCLRRVGAYLRYIISARWGRPDHPLNREELYLSLIKTQFIPSGDPSSDIGIDGTAKAEFVDVKVYGDTYQQSYTGKNLFEAVPYSDPIQQGLTITITNTNTIHIEGTANTTYSNLTNNMSCLLPSGQPYTFCIDKVLTHNLSLRTTWEGGYADRVITPGNQSITFTPGNDITSMRIFMATRGAGNTFNETITAQLVTGSTPDYDFEPYVGGQPSPSPEYPQPIQTVTGLQTVEVAGKNLLNVNGIVLGGGYTGLTVQLVNKDESTGTIGIRLTGNVDSTLWSIYARTNDIRLEPNTTYTLSRTFSESGGLRSAGGIRVKIGSSYTTTTTDASTTFTTDSTGIVQVLIYAAYNQQGPTSNIDSIVVFSSLLLEKGSTATTFEAYGSNEYEINLGKNLFDKSKQVSGWLNSTGGISQPTSTADKTSDYMECSPNTSYTLSSPGYYLKIAQYDANKTFIKLDQSGNNIPSLTVDTAWNAAYIRISYGNAQKEPNVQFEAGSHMTAYAPYFEPIELCKIGTYQDYIWKDQDKWKIHKETFKHQFDGVGDGWNYGSITHALQDQNFSVSQTGAVKFDVPGVALSRDFTYFPNPGGITSVLPNGCFGFQTSGSYYATFRNDAAFTTKENAIAWIRANKPTLYWALATPTDTVITNQALIDQLEALVKGGSEEGTTYIKVSATDPNLPGLLYVEAAEYI